MVLELVLALMKFFKEIESSKAVQSIVDFSRKTKISKGWLTVNVELSSGPRNNLVIYDWVAIGINCRKLGYLEFEKKKIFANILNPYFAKLRKTKTYSYQEPKLLSVMHVRLLLSLKLTNFWNLKSCKIQRVLTVDDTLILHENAEVRYDYVSRFEIPMAPKSQIFSWIEIMNWKIDSHINENYFEPENKQIGRLPLACFLPTSFAKDAF